MRNKTKKNYIMHWPGIEPGPPAWQARILPLNHQCKHKINFFQYFNVVSSVQLFLSVARKGGEGMRP